MISLRNAILLGLTFVFLFPSCKKNIFNKTSILTLNISLTESPNSNEYLKFNNGFISVSELKINGSREEGEHLSLSKRYKDNTIINLENHSEKELDVFSIPQGLYNDLSTILVIKSDDTNSQFSVEGTYLLFDSTSFSRKEIPILVNISFDQEIEMQGVKSGEDFIVIDAKKSTVANITFNPSYWFEPVTTYLLDNAEISLINKQSSIVISPIQNTKIYNLIINRIQESSLISFHQKS